MSGSDHGKLCRFDLVFLLLAFIGSTFYVSVSGVVAKDPSIGNNLSRETEGSEFQSLYQTFTHTEDLQIVQRFLKLPLDMHLRAADMYIDRFIHRLGQAKATERISILSEARKHLSQARQKWDYYDSDIEGFLSEQWKQHDNNISPDPNAPRLDQSPLTLLAHLVVAEDRMTQIAVQNRVVAQQYSEEQSHRIQALREADDSVELAIKAVEEAVGMIVYRRGSPRFLVEIPHSYQSQRTSNNMPVSTVKKNEEGKALASVFIQLREAEYEQSPQDYFQKRMKALEKKFPDLNARILESSLGSGHAFSAKYSYGYTWEGDPIKAKIWVSKWGQKAIELNCLAVENHNNKQEFDQIIESFHRLP